MTMLAITKFILSSPLTWVVVTNTAFVVFDTDWPPIHQDKGVTLVFPWVIWATYMSIELYGRIVDGPPTDG